jgi:dipeptidyl aminopeptidase/acylaminoacyl peptidase
MLAFNAIFDGYPAEIVLTNLAGAQPVSFLLPRPAGMHIKGYGSPLQWRQQELYFLGEEKARVRLIKAANLASDTKPTFANLTPADVVVEGFHLAQASSKVIGILADPEHFPDLFDLEATIDPAGSPEFRRRLTRVNPQTASWKLPKLSVVSWKGAGGDTVEGILELPPDYQPGKKVPLVVEIHGGPTTASYFKLQYWIYGRTLLPAKGYAVLCPNYRGSTGYGDKFLTDLVGRENDLDVGDILKGVDSLVDQGIADLDRLAVTGWSNGGYQTTRFKAAISGAGIVDAAMEFGSNDEPAYTIVFKQGFPWSNPDRYHKASSTYALDKVRTPTLIHVGANDDRCPPAHSRMLYRALKEYINVPTELLVYPGEAHGLMKYRNRQAKLQWDLAWLERYVLGKK